MTQKHTKYQMQEKLKNFRVKYGNQENITKPRMNKTSKKDPKQKS